MDTMKNIKRYFLKLLRLERQYCWMPTWLDDLKRNIGIKRANFFFAIYHHVPFIEWVLCSLCELEMSFSVMLCKGLKEDLDTCSVINKYSGKCDWQEKIPKDTMYCSGCEYGSVSYLANFFFGSQCDGYCYYLGKGDFSYIQPTDLLWDGCKCCGHFEFSEEEDE